MTQKEKINFLTENIKGIGPAKAEKIAIAYKDMDNLLDIEKTREEYERMSSVVGTSLAASVIEQISEIKKQDDFVKVMVSCGIPYFTSVNIVKTELLFKAFKKDPYTIGRQNGIDFVSCDKFAHVYFMQYEKSPDMDKARMQYFIEATLLSLENSGHTFAYLNQLVKKMNTYQKKNEYLPDSYEESTVALYFLDDENLTIEKAPKLSRWKVCRKETSDLESDIAYHIKRLSVNKRTEDVPNFEGNGMNYDDVQLAAIESAAFNGLKIITGPPGSGKTAVVKGIINYFNQIKKNAKIVLCAPTGRAAKHMTEITGKESSTIHRLLGIGEKKQFVRKKKLVCDMVIVDEASMLNLDITYELLSRIETGTVVYFIGDKDQLPAVGPGNVLHDIINSKVVPVYHLTKVYRQDGIILENAHEINNGIVPTRQNKQYIQKSFDSETALRDAAVEWFESNYDKNEPFETQILIPSYKTKCGITEMNTVIQDLNPENYVYISATQKYKKFDKILMTKNDKDGLYQNGSVGVLISNMGDEFVVEFDGEETILPKSAIDDMTLGYAISVHKSQGSEYKHVLLCLPNKPVNMLKRNIIYTAVTRAKKDIVILEMPGTIQKSVETSTETFMQTNLKQKLMSVS